MHSPQSVPRPLFPQLRDEAWLREKYEVEGLTYAELAEAIGCSAAAVCHATKRYGIEARKGSQRPRIVELRDGAWLREQYEAKERRSEDIAEELGCSMSAVQRALVRHGIPFRPRAHAGLWTGAGGHKLRGRQQAPEHVEKRRESTRRRLASTPVPCETCGEMFFRTRPAQKYCSGSCWNRVNRQRKGSDLRGHRWTAADYRRLAEVHGETCGICGTATGRVGRGRLAVDHDHRTDAVRGLLCHRCNTAIGLMRDDPALLEAAIAYLKRHKGVKPHG